MKTYRFVRMVLIVGVVAVLTGCASAPKVGYVDPKDQAMLSTKYSETDLDMMATKMVESLQTFPPIVQVTKERRPVILVLPIKNKTTEHIDLESLTDTISTKLVQSGQFRFVDREKLNDALKEMSLADPSLNMVDPDTAARAGRVVGAEYMLYGNLSSITDAQKQATGVYYKLTMKLTSIETNTVEWSEEKEIKKIVTRSKVGW